MKVNKAQIRRDAAKSLAEAFLNSGKPYTCLASVNAVRPMAIGIAEGLLLRGINLSKSNYPFAFAGLMADMFLHDAMQIVHEHFYPKEKA